MFSKLLKYDFKSVKKYGLPLIIVSWGLALFGAIMGFFVGKNIMNAVDNDAAIFSTGLGAIGIIGLIYALAICASVVALFVYVDFYKSLCTDQGYLTFTLPVKSTTLLNSKLVNSLIWNLMSAVTIIGGVFLVVLGVVIGGSTGAPDMGSSGEAVESIFSLLDFGNAVSTIIMIVAYAINTQVLFFMVIFFASIITDSHKAVTAIGLIIATNIAYSLIYSLVASIVYNAVESTGDLASILSSLICTALLIGSGIGYYFLTKYMMEKKLNLS